MYLIDLLFAVSGFIRPRHERLIGGNCWKRVSALLPSTAFSELRRFQCYETTLVVSYCRPFSESVGDFPRLSHRALGIKLSPFVRALHDDIVDKRNKLFAHSDVGSVEYVLPALINGGDAEGSPFTTLVSPRFREGTLLQEAEFEQVSVSIECTSNAVMRMLQAMHVHFADRYPSTDFETL